VSPAWHPNGKKQKGEKRKKKKRSGLRRAHFSSRFMRSVFMAAAHDAGAEDSAAWVHWREEHLMHAWLLSDFICHESLRRKKSSKKNEKCFA
jgi:hypothetical protein